MLSLHNKILKMDILIENRHKNLFLSITLGIISWLTPENVELAIKILVGSGSFVASGFACVNYYYSIKKNRKK